MAFQLKDKVKLVNLHQQSEIRNFLWSDKRPLGAIGTIFEVLKDDWYIISLDNSPLPKQTVAHKSELNLVRTVYKKRDWVIVINLDKEYSHFIKANGWSGWKGRVIGNIGYMETPLTEEGWYRVVMTEHSFGGTAVHESEIMPYIETDDLEWLEPPNTNHTSENNPIAEWLAK